MVFIFWKILENEILGKFILEKSLLKWRKRCICKEYKKYYRKYQVSMKFIYLKEDNFENIEYRIMVWMSLNNKLPLLEKWGEIYLKY